MVTGQYRSMMVPTNSARAICGLTAGAVDESMQLWVRMSTGNSNYVTNRILWKRHRKGGCESNSVASMDLIDDMHQMMKSNRWDQKSGGRGHYSAMLRVLRKYLGSHMDGDASSIEEEAATRFSKLESIWEEVGKSGYLDDDKSSLGRELYAMRLQSLVNLAVAVDDARSHEGIVEKKQKEKDIGSERPADLDVVETIKAELLQLVDLLEESKKSKRRDKVEKRILHWQREWPRVLKVKERLIQGTRGRLSTYRTCLGVTGLRERRLWVNLYLERGQ